MAKSADAFRTISEVAEILAVPAHVLRFWESRFPQVKPVKRAGGRRYYRPDDIRLLSGIRLLLHDDGMTIKGVQKILREHGVQHVANMAPATSELQEPSARPTPRAALGAEVLSFERRGDRDGASNAQATAAKDAETASGALPQDVAQDPHPVSAPVATEPPAAAPPEPAPTDTPEPPARPDAAASASPPENPAPPPAAPPLPALPDLPEDPSDTAPATPGALAALAGLHAPVPADLAQRLATIAARLRDLGPGDRDTGASTGAVWD